MEDAANQFRTFLTNYPGVARERRVLDWVQDGQRVPGRLDGLNSRGKSNLEIPGGGATWHPQGET